MADVSRISNLVICGPTASGKSALAMAVAERLGGEILSVDSMQVYRGMDIGTAKPTAEEQRRVRHHLINVIEPTATFTVADFVNGASAVLHDAARRRVPIIVMGGTPLYYKALFEGLFEGPAADDSLRAAMADRSSAHLHDRLKQIDPATAERLHVNDRRRVLRAIEVHTLTGRPLSDLQQQWGSKHRHEATWFGMTWDKDVLNRRINARVKQMIADGWLDEARSLGQKFGVLSQTAGEAIGYAELFNHLAGAITLDDAVERIKIATRQLARRQTKWFRRWPDVRSLDGTMGHEILADLVCSIANAEAKQ